MNWNRLKKGVAGMAIILTLLLSGGMGLQNTAQAQDRGRDNNWRRDRDDRRDRDWYRRQQYQRARELELRRQRERNRDWYGYQRNYPYGTYGNSGRYSGSAYNSELQRGYRNGLKEGGDDARDRDSFNPNRHSSFRDGNSAYRDGFARGYEQGYRQYAGYRRW